MRIADELQADCPVFYVDNVAEYFGAVHPPKSRGVEINALPQLLPPFEKTWIEYARDRPGVPTHQMAARIIAERLPVAYAPIAWGLTIDTFERAPTLSNRIVQSRTSLLLFIDEAGQLLMAVDESAPNDPCSHLDWNVAEGCKRGQGIRLLAPILLAISFMHCKNVRHVEHATPKVHPNFLRSTGKKPRLKFYTLEIDPMREVLRREGNIEQVGLKQALHICRGHFKDYRQSGLFGKIKGIFWWDSTVRGTTERGVVVKDYLVKLEAPRTVH